jgi:hyperosmotically inducible periplasmic protein
MKKTITYGLLLAGLVALPVAFTTGCAVTRGQESAGQYVDDKTITAKVKTALAKDPIVKAMDVNVTTFQREVQLSGYVDTQEQKSRAGELAQTIEGVKTVHNDLVVKTGR